MKNNNGFTLIETLIYTALTGIVMTGIITFALLILELKSKNYVIGEVNANARTALNIIADKIRAAEQVISPTPGSSSNTLILDAVVGGNETVSASNNTLIFNKNSINTNITNSKITISNLNFRNLGGAVNDNIRITFDVGYRDANSLEFTYSKSFQTAVSLRR